MLKAFGWVALFILVIATIGGGVACYFLVPCWRCVITPNRYHPDPAPGYPGLGSSGMSPLKTLTSAQADFRAYDRDGNGVKDFWRKDIAGLYVMPGVDGKPLKLVELTVAKADERPLCNIGAYGILEPRRGYWYRAIRHQDEDPQKLDPQRFAYAAIPVASPRHWKYVYIVDENNTVFRSDEPFNLNVSVFPTDLAAAGWSKLD